MSTALSLNARRVLRTDTRYAVGRRFRYDKLASLLLFPPDPSEYRSDLVWVKDVSHTMRRQPGVVGPDGLYPTVHYRTKGQLQWNIPLMAWRILDSDLEAADTDVALQPRLSNLTDAVFKARIEREISAWKVLKDPSVMTQNITLTAGSRFDDITSTSSDPIAVMQLGAELIFRKTGLKVTDIMIPQPIMRRLTQHEKIMSYAVAKMNLNAGRAIDGGLIEELIGFDYIEKGAIKVYDMVFNNTPDGPSLLDNEDYVYPSGPNVIMTARAVPGGADAVDYGFGLGKSWQFLDKSLPENKNIEIATGNDGFGVFVLPNYDLIGGGTTTQLVSAWGPFVQNAEAAYAIFGAADASDYDEYQGSLLF